VPISVLIRLHVLHQMGGALKPTWVCSSHRLYVPCLQVIVPLQAFPITYKYAIRSNKQRNLTLERGENHMVVLPKGEGVTTSWQWCTSSLNPIMTYLLSECYAANCLTKCPQTRTPFCARAPTLTLETCFNRSSSPRACRRPDQARCHHSAQRWVFSAGPALARCWCGSPCLQPPNC
jgi:hypothetical protein